MKKDCRNDCVEALRFPKRLNNRPGLSHIDYRIGTYSDIREALLRNLDKKENLSAWTYRGADDPGIALLEGASILGDILTFYQQLYANEAYLRTAQWRESISDLVRLLGYRLSPGLGGQATFAFEVKGDKPVTIPPGFPLKAEVEGSTSPVDFETTKQAIAYPWLSKFNLYQPLATPSEITASTVEFYIESPDQLTAASPVVLKAGDRLMLGEIDSTTNPLRLNNAEIVIVDSVRELHGVKLFKIKGKLKRKGPPLPDVPQLAAYKLGRSFHHFGHNGPRTLVQPPDSITSTVTNNDDGSTTVESDPPLEYDISFFRSISGDTQSDTIFVDYAKPKPKATSTGGAYYAQEQSQGQYVIGYANQNQSMSNASMGAYSWAVNESSYMGVVASSPKPVVITDPVLAKTEFPLDAEVQDMATGVTLIVQTKLYNNSGGGTSGEYAIVRDIKAIRTTSVTWGLSTATVSLLTLSQALDTSADSGFNYMNITEVQFHETLSPLLTLRAAYAPDSPSSLDTLNFYGTSAQAQTLAGRDLIFVKANAEPVRANVKTVEAGVDDAQARLHKITIDRADLNYADFPNTPPYPVTVYGNIVDATQGKTEALTPLGNGDSRLAFQTFKIPKSPLTYLHSESATPPEVPELQIYVNNRLWKRVSSFFGRKPDEEIYIVREDAEGDSWVQFGDGKTGARLPSGIKNVAAAYRTGTGAFGALKEKATVQAGARLEQLDKIQMPVPASGGAQPEDGENARDAAPGKIQSLDRLVSLEDFEREALAMAGVTRAAAAWQLVEGIPQVVLTVLMEEGRSETTEHLTKTFAEANSGRGPDRFPITANPGKLQYVAIKATFGFDSTYLEEEVRKGIQKALGVSTGKPGDDQSGLFSLRRRNFGQKEYATTVAGVIQQVEGVMWVTVDGFD
ncbi:MAG TPA: hypothetical protein VKB86_19920, partial [Pyrinomonadaceae bacterium]|nr:hypothetical protein [Pyrinomonadaceae bacterium]